MIRFVALGMAALLMAVAFAAPFGRGLDTPGVRIYVMQTDDTALQVIYEWRTPERDAVFSTVPNGYRQEHWNIITPGLELVSDDNVDRIRKPGGGKFKRLELIARPSDVRLDKEYQPIAEYGVGGLLVYTGHLWPETKSGEYVNATFDFTPAAGAQVVAFGDRALRLENWRSPEAHPAFIYMGPLAPVETEDVMAVIDPQAPRWIIAEFNSLVPSAFAALSDVFGFSPDTKPNLFLSAAIDGEPGRLSYAGDALPSQFQIMLRGGAWARPNRQARDVFTHSTIHEAVHLWQTGARPRTDDTPEWIHEGAAEAIAGEVMVRLGIWDGAAFERNAAAARNECATTLENGSLNGASARGDFRALYVCGQVIAEATARADGKTVADFWKALIERAGEEDGYTEEMFYDLIEARTGDEDFAQAVRHFARTPLAEPAVEISRLMDAARAASS
ncbi:hypothetical protein PUV54_15685 [Hyphococcus flavus]|uniref:Peptidase MA-like domain-containing protein n=1 Tax=Hyphococcus flavus TaxID=1866326 RepID=A0AAF0CEJ9_9PROT|nr:hypothetical protein [Hyphococcus flavus]WDI31391.1 hypothetical protein PUV54_15685 [Hyphococcus flavus]